jgi:hypothetical protein
VATASLLLPPWLARSKRMRQIGGMWARAREDWGRLCLTQIYGTNGERSVTAKKMGKNARSVGGGENGVFLKKMFLGVF